MMIDDDSWIIIVVSLDIPNFVEMVDAEYQAW